MSPSAPIVERRSCPGPTLRATSFRLGFTSPVDWDSRPALPLTSGRAPAMDSSHCRLRAPRSRRARKASAVTSSSGLTTTTAGSAGRSEALLAMASLYRRRASRRPAPSPDWRDRQATSAGPTPPPFSQPNRARRRHANGPEGVPRGPRFGQQLAPSVAQTGPMGSRGGREGAVQALCGHIGRRS